VPQYVTGDQHKLQQVLNNLLSNAVKFTGQGAVTLFATTEKRGDNSLYFICSVTDTGIGIAPENVEHVFESFVQAGSDMVRRFGGTGLGLAITRRLIELQGGKITVSSTVDEGSSFYFELPMQVCEGVQEQARKEDTVVKETCNKALKGKHILLIEDNLVNQKVTCLMLQKAGMTVDIANHGKEAVELLQKESYDLIISDLQMPEMDGFQTAAYIRTKLHLATPIIAMTASALRNEKERCLEIGMNEYLTKPFAPAVLFHHLRRYLAGGDEWGIESGILLPEIKITELYNLSYLEEMDDADYATEVLELFLSSTPVALSAIKEAVLEEEWTEVYKKAHSLKSSLGILQVNKMLETVTQIETKAKQQTDTEIIETLLQRALKQYDLVKPALEAELNSFTKQKAVL
jgi:CheY-like chemotaxis protein